MLFEFNYDYHPYIFYKKDINPYSKSKSEDRLLTKL